MGEDPLMPTTNRPFRIRHVLVAIGLVGLTATLGLPTDRAAAAQVTGGGFTSNAGAAPASVSPRQHGHDRRSR